MTHPHPTKHDSSHARGPHGVLHVLSCRTCGPEAPVFQWSDLDPKFYGEDVKLKLDGPS